MHFLILLFGLLGGVQLAAQGRAGAAVTVQEVSLDAGDRKISCALAIFAEQDFIIRVIDNAGDGDQGKFPTLADAMNALDCAAGCNGGFFERTPFSPAGLMISDGRRAGYLNLKSWMKGLLVVRDNHPTLESTESFQDGPDVKELIQSGPWLVRAGQPETDSNKRQMARRTFICHDGRGRWAIGASDYCTLHELATLLKSAPVTAVLDIQYALNLDGGPSTGLWAKRSPNNFYWPERWAVRNYLGIFPRAAK